MLTTSTILMIGSNLRLIRGGPNRSLIFSKKFFWFSDEPLESEHLSGYLRAEKAELAHHNVAHAGHTGKGLLFFAKRVEDKDHPTGILNLVGFSAFRSR